MRDQGIEIDDTGAGGVAISGNKDEVRRASEKCRQYLPNGGEPPRLSPEDMERMREYAKCMRENGLPSFPDPEPETGQFSGDALREAGVTKAKIAEVDEKCRHKLPTTLKKGVGK
jgi:hypothetical protein